ncbi:hypothetical protein ACHAWF_003535 [Thalassiosira exigua]
MWLTPVELFYPYFSNILANFVCESVGASRSSFNGDGPFEIVELGGGRGTNAKAVLTHLRECHPDMYRRLRSYTIYDTSTTLQVLQRNVLEGSGHGDKVQFVHTDMIHIAEAEGTSKFLAQSEVPTAVLAMELLDNLPHDKIGRAAAASAQCASETGDIMQAEVVPLVPIESSNIGDNSEAAGELSLDRIDTSVAYEEIFSSLNDPLLTKILSVAPSLYTPMSAQGPRWIPTVALGILMQLFESRPNCSIAFADFDWLPPPDENNLLANQHGIERIARTTEPAIGEPIVTDMEGNDHMCYLTSPPNVLCDILFPTDFGRLAEFVGMLNKHAPTAGVTVDAVSMKQKDFLMKYGTAEVDKTKGWTGYSPLIHDFGNCSVLLATSRST